MGLWHRVIHGCLWGHTWVMEVQARKKGDKPVAVYVCSECRCSRVILGKAKKKYRDRSAKVISISERKRA